MISTGIKAQVEVRMKKIIVLISIVCIFSGCKDDEELPEQGHTGAVIDVQRLKEAPIVQSIHAELDQPTTELPQDYNRLESASMVQTSHNVPEGPVIQIQNEKNELNN